ncbi:MAG TPA: type 4a pilus biogenesis protein PilO [Gammaproteobacteria bacterium]|nr:type 4a pilus biogenesis protein PilO [Gammaproteobacteria bacterium]
MNLSELNNLDIHNVGNWPLPARAIIIALLCIMVLGAGYWYDTQDQLQLLQETQAKEQELRQSFETKQAKAANLDAYKKQMEEMKQSFGAMLRQLPSKAEVADLLVDISQTGLASGLEFELFSPKAEVTKDFYAELPIAIRVTGSYHQLGNFISSVAALPRIVTLHDIGIHPASDNKLVMDVTGKTYRYLDEPAAPAKEAGK